MPGQRRSREQLYDHDDIILLDPSKAVSADDTTKPISPLQQIPPRCPIELPPEISQEKLSQKSKSLAPDAELPYTLPPSDRTRSMGDIELPSMNKRTKPVTLHNYRTKRLLEDRLVTSSIMVTWRCIVWMWHNSKRVCVEKPIRVQWGSMCWITHQLGATARSTTSAWHQRLASMCRRLPRAILQL